MKKFLSVFLSSVIMMSFNIYAQDYENIVSKVKNTLDIEAYENFDCSEYSNNNTKFLNINWNNEDNNSYIEVTCDMEGNIYNYFAYNNQRDKTHIYDEIQCKKTADDFLKKILGDNYSNIKYVDYFSSYETFTYTYNIINGEIPFSSGKINVTVNKYLNTVLNSSVPYNLFDIKTDNFASTISEERAKEILKNKFDLVYITTYDYEKEKYNEHE